MSFIRVEIGLLRRAPAVLVGEHQGELRPGLGAPGGDDDGGHAVRPGRGGGQQVRRAPRAPRAAAVYRGASG